MTTRRAAALAALVLLAGLALGPGRAQAADPPPPRYVHLTTRPALPGATFTFDGASFTTGADGSVTITTAQLTDLEQRLRFVSVADAPNTSAHFDHFEMRPELNDVREAIAVFDMSRFLHLTTVPALPNATFLLDGLPSTTGADGSVTIDTTRLVDLDQRLRFASVSTDPLMSASFVRFEFPPQAGYWRDVVATFDVSHAVQFSFADPDGDVVPIDRVTSMKVRTSTGQELTFSKDDLGQPIMLPAIHVLSAAQQHAQQLLRYTVQEVVADGTNTVVPSQQEFFPAQAGAVRVDAMFFTLQISVHDALFGFASGSDVVIRRPDGTEDRYPVTGGKVTIEGVARGDYQVRADGAGYASWRPITVSRDQTVELAPVSRLDLGVIASVMILVLGGLLVIGNRRRAHRRRRLSPPPPHHGGVGAGSPPPPPPGTGQEEPIPTPEPVG